MFSNEVCDQAIRITLKEPIKTRARAIRTAASVTVCSEIDDELL